MVSEDELKEARRKLQSLELDVRRYILSPVRALVLSPSIADPAHRRKLRELTGLGWSIVAATPGGTAGEERGIRLAPIPVSGSADPDAGALRWSGRAIRRLLTDTRPDLVAIEAEPTTQAADVTSREAARLGIPSVVFSAQSLPFQRSILANRRYQHTLSRAGGVAGINSLATALLRAAAPGVPAAVLSAVGVVPPTPPQREPHDGLRMAYVGRLVHERGAESLLRVCGQLMGSWTLRIAGTGPEQEALEELAQRLGLASRIRWLGVLSRSQVAALWSEVDCLVVPSRATPTWVDGWSEVMLDAMGHEVAVVASRTGALPEIIGDAGIGYDNEEDFLVRLQELVTDTPRILPIGQAGRRRVLEYYVDAAVARATDVFWREVLGARRLQ